MLCARPAFWRGSFFLFLFCFLGLNQVSPSQAQAAVHVVTDNSDLIPINQANQNTLRWKILLAQAGDTIVIPANTTITLGSAGSDEDEFGLAHDYFFAWDAEIKNGASLIPKPISWAPFLVYGFGWRRNGSMSPHNSLACSCSTPGAFRMER